MQVDASYGIVPDTQAEILEEYLSFFRNVFPDANSPDSPAYVIANTCSFFDSKIQKALQVGFNSINSNTTSGIGQDILSNTILNLYRKGLTPSTVVLKIIAENLLSYIDITVDVTVASPQIIPINWEVSGVVSPSPAYKSYIVTNIPISGVYVIRVYSTDTTTDVLISQITGGDAVAGIVFNSVTNLGTSVLGTLVIPSTWAVSASAVNNSPVYTPNQIYTFNKVGTYYILLYSNNIVANIAIGQLNTFTQINNVNPTPQPMIAGITNLYSNVLGLPAESDAQFAIRRRYYLNVEGQTYYGLEKVILNLQAPALKSVFVNEFISDTYNPAICIIKVSIVVVTTVTIPTNWTVYGTAVTTAPYKTLSPEVYTISGDYYVLVYSLDTATPIPASNFTSGDPIVGVTVVGNLEPAVLNTTIGLGQRGYQVFLNYPTIPYSTCIIRLDVTVIGGSPPYIIPIGWAVNGTITTSPYITQETYSISATGIYFLTVYSTDYTTNIAPGAFTGGDGIAGVTFTVSNNVYGSLGGIFDVNDIYLQKIASAAFQYHPLGTQFYPDGQGSTIFEVNTPYSGYTSQVVLNPIEIFEATMSLTLVYNVDVADAGFSNGIFPPDLITGGDLKIQLINIVNNYFNSKTLPTDLVFSINELSIIIQDTYTGIVALNSNVTPFTMGTVSPPVSGRVFLRRPIGGVYNLTSDNFTFSILNKDSL